MRVRVDELDRRGSIDPVSPMHRGCRDASDYRAPLRPQPRPGRTVVNGRLPTARHIHIAEARAVPARKFATGEYARGHRLSPDEYFPHTDETPPTTPALLLPRETTFRYRNRERRRTGMSF